MSSARAVALRLLSRRDYTAAELREKLASREFAADEIDEVIASLRAESLVDDRRAAEAHVRTASRVKHRGRLRIQRELEARGVDRSIIRELLSELPAAAEAGTVARFLRRHELPARLTLAQRRRVFQQLLRRGFAPEVIAKALRTREEDPDEG